MSPTLLAVIFYLNYNINCLMMSICKIKGGGEETALKSVAMESYLVYNGDRIKKRECCSTPWP
jgi:hypothetical protein